MDLTLAMVILVIVIALAFDYTNGFHDAANAIATSVSTRALTPRRALIMAAIMNVFGALMGTEVAKTIGNGIIDLTGYMGTNGQTVSTAGSIHGLTIVLGALIGAVVWNLITWWYGLPSSSSHALIGGLIGAGLASGVAVQWGGVVDHVVIPMIASPLVGFTAAYILMKILLYVCRNLPYHRTMRRFRIAQTVSAALMALGHGLQDAQKTMGVIVMALMAGGYHGSKWWIFDNTIFNPATGEMVIPLWVKLAAAGAISAGTYSGGWRIMRTLGRKVIELDPAHGFVAESVAASVLYLSAYVFHAPISTTHTITSSIMGVGATKRLSAVRWGVAGNIAVAWVLTLPMAALVAAIMYWIAYAIVGI